LSSSSLTRFAPSPTGRLHIGHAHAAAAVFGFAVENSGRALLRIEDIDHTRCAHYSAYAKVVIDLIERGLAYPCGLSRTHLKAGKRTPRPTSPSHGKAAKVCDKMREAMRFKTPSLPFAIRLNLEAALKRAPKALPYSDSGTQQLQALPSLEAWAKSTRPDPVIARRDIGASYHIAVTHDDELQGITHIVRGADFIDQTPLHILIQNLMGWRTPIYHHHALITDMTGRKLSKTAKDKTIESLRESGMSPADVLSLAARGSALGGLREIWHGGMSLSRLAFWPF